MKKHCKPLSLLDSYLAALGLWRKPVARDGFSLFRAVSEQAFQTQTFYMQLYNRCRMFFKLYGKDPETEWNELEVMKILSTVYRLDIFVYDVVGAGPFSVTNSGFERKVVLCRVDESQLDPVYPSNFVQNAALCQSIIYEILYHGVFGMDSELNEAVMLIRDQNKKKSSVACRLEMNNAMNSTDRRYRTLHFSTKDFSKRVSPPVPYRIAKALDPSIFRNVELDIWEEEKREHLREANLKRQFSPGDKCQVVLNDNQEVYNGHIQEISENEGPVLVFIEEIGAKRMVPFSSLKAAPIKYSSLSESFSGRNSSRRRGMPIAAYQNSQASSQHSSPASSPDKYCPSDIDNGNFQSSDLSQRCLAEPQQYYHMGMININSGTNDTSSNNYTNMTNGSTPNNDMNNKGVTSSVNSGSMAPPPAVPQINPRYPPPNMPMQTMASNPYMYPGTPGVVSAPNQTPPGYTCICLPFLDTIDMNKVNLASCPSQDPAGKDIPSDMNTLRFFYNLGIEHYQQLCQGGPLWSPMEMGGMVPVADQINGNSCGQFPLPPPPFQVTAQTNHQNVPMSGEKPNIVYPMVYPVYKTSTFNNPNPQADKSLPTAEQLTTLCSSSKSDSSHGDKTSDSKLSDQACGDCNDSGCDSDSISGSAQDDGLKDVLHKAESSACDNNEFPHLNTSPSFLVGESDKSVNVNDAASFASSLDFQEQSINGNKSKGKRKYYMYGNLRLIKPIKDIPPRFLSLLAESSAARARCEGEPIIVPYLPPRRHYRPQVHTQQHQQSFGFNPDAKCFVPGQPVDLISHDPSIVAFRSELDNSHINACNIPSSSVGAHNENTNVLQNHSNNPMFCSPPNPSNQGSYTVYMYGSPNYSAAATNNPGDGAVSHTVSGGGNPNTSCMPSHSTGAGQSYHQQPFSCPVYYTNPQYALQGPQTVAQVPHIMPQGPIPYMSVSQQQTPSQAFQHPGMMQQISITQMPLVQASQ